MALLSMYLYIMVLILAEKQGLDTVIRLLSRSDRRPGINDGVLLRSFYCPGRQCSPDQARSGIAYEIAFP